MINFDPRMAAKLRCPVSHLPLLYDGPRRLVTFNGQFSYHVTKSGIPLFAEQYCSKDARRQQEHYDKVAAKYIENLQYPHTQEYMNYLDTVFREVITPADLSEAAEICCGRGELLGLFGENAVKGVGVDISSTMLEAGTRFHKNPGNFIFIQGDATKLPLGDEEFSGVFMLGGIHHVMDREALFREAFRILRPGGHLYWREPVNDFFLWRLLRKVIYRLSPTLDSKTERPLRLAETLLPLERAGFRLKLWKTYGFLGFCFFMNSDVLMFNKFFRFIPGIRSITRVAVCLDDWVTNIPRLRYAGLQVIGVAEKHK